jgi:hypothetical protein
MPDIPTLSSPITGSTDQALNPVLTWNTSNRAASYTLQVSSVSNFSSTVVNQSSITSTSHSVSGLVNNTKYYWHVSATNTGGTSDWSEVWNFTTIPAVPEIPTLSNPTNNSTDQAVSLTLSWNVASGADSYALQVSTSTGFNSTFLNKSGINSTSELVSGLKNNTTYFWRVNATNAGGTSAWAIPWSFTTQAGFGIEEISENSNYLFYPNPANNILTIESHKSGCTAKIISLEGRPIFITTLNEGVNKLDLSSLGGGIYFIRFENQENVITRKLIKQ